MSASAAFTTHLIESLAGLGPVQVRRMFGGAGVYCDGVMLGLVSDDTLYLKADDTSQAAFAAEGLGPFVYRGGARPMTMSYWRAPERLLDDPDEMVAWARTALAVARKAAAAKSRPQRKPRRDRT